MKVDNGKNKNTSNKLHKKENKMLNTMKDKALSKGANIALNKYVSKYGHIGNLSLNTKFKTMQLKILLDGDVKPIDVHIENYELIDNDSKHFLKISGIKTSKQWLDRLADEYLESKEFHISSEYATILKAII